MDVPELLAQLRAEVATARGMPLSASCVLNREAVLLRLDAIAAALPERLAEADRLLADRSAFLTDAHADAEALRSAAKEQAQAELARSASAGEAHAWAEELRKRTQAEIAERLHDAEDELDGRLAEVEVSLERTLRLARSEAADPGDSLTASRARLAELAEVVETMLVGVRRGRDRVHRRSRPAEREPVCELASGSQAPEPIEPVDRREHGTDLGAELGDRLVADPDEGDLPGSH